mgnify:CR=1 FL=1
MNRIISVIGEESIITPSPGPVTSPSVTPTEDGEIKVTNPDVKNGIAETSISATAITNAINTSVVDGDSGFKIATAKIPAIDGVNEYRIKLPAEAFNASKPDAKIRIITQVAQIDLPNNMLSNDEFSGENLIISVSEVDKTKLSEEVADKIGDRPVISINAYNENRKITWNNNDAPVTVSIKYQLKGIERISDEFLTVWYIDDDGNCYPITNARYDLKTGCITFNITHFSTYAVVYSRIKFKDLAKHNWARLSIEIMASKGAITGVAPDRYDPAAYITRADYIQFIVSTLDLHADFIDNFSDVDVNSYYYNAIGIAKKLGIIEGIGNNKFAPESHITRQDMMVITANALKYAKGLVDGSEEELAAFADSEDISSYARKAVAALVKSGIIVGSGGKIYPLNNTTRAEAAVIMYRLYNIEPSELENVQKKN